MNEEQLIRHKIQEQIEYMLRRYGTPAPSYHPGGYVGPPQRPQGGWYDQGGIISQRDAQIASRDVLEKLMRGYGPLNVPEDPYAVIDSTEVGQRLKAESEVVYEQRRAKLAEAKELLQQANEIDDLRRDLARLDLSELEALDGAPREWIESFRRQR